MSVFQVVCLAGELAALVVVVVAGIQTRRELRRAKAASVAAMASANRAKAATARAMAAAEEAKAIAARWAARS